MYESEIQNHTLTLKCRSNPNHRSNDFKNLVGWSACLFVRIKLLKDHGFPFQRRWNKVSLGLTNA
jgi:hypothetical protein